MKQGLDGNSCSRPAGQAASHLVASRIDQGRIALALERVGRVLIEVDYDCGHFITGDNLKIMDVQILYDLAKATEATNGN